MHLDAIRMRPSDRKCAAGVYARAFFNYPEMVSHWPDPKRRGRYLEWYLGCAINYGIRYGEVYTTPDVAGLAIWLPPGHTQFSIWRFIRSGFLLTPFLMGIRRSFTEVMREGDVLQKAHAEIAPGPHWYLWGLAVDPEQQGRGIGTVLMQPVMQRADAQQLLCYLETHDEKNVAFYLKRGFALVRTQQIPGTELRFWSFLREPRKQ